MLKRVVVATSNDGKVKEIRRILSGIEIISINEMKNGFFVEERGNSYLENAYLKVFHAYKLVKEPVIAEDSGLEVLSLNNRPGVFSARYGNKKNDRERVEFLLEEMKNKEDRRARFVNFTLFMWDKDEGAFFEGICKGRIANSPMGEFGFGYDPIFIPEGYQKSFAQLGEDVKNKISHRTKALTKLKKFLSLYSGYGE